MQFRRCASKVVHATLVPDTGQSGPRASGFGPNTSAECARQSFRSAGGGAAGRRWARSPRFHGWSAVGRPLTTSLGGGGAVTGTGGEGSGAGGGGGST